MRRFEMIQVLLKCRIIELRKKFLLRRRIEPADLLYELTFVHGVFTFQWREKT